MADRCLIDGGECYHECYGCNAYRGEIDCPECGNPTLRSELDKHGNMCKVCFIKDCFGDRELLEEFFKDNPDIEEAYKDYIYDTKFGGK